MPRRIVPRYHVAPRYTAGSPAMVDQMTAHRVALQEKYAFNRVVQGYIGEEEADRARTMGLERIAYATLEVGKRVLVHDLITDRTWTVPTKYWTGQHWYERTDTKKFLDRTERRPHVS